MNHCTSCKRYARIDGVVKALASVRLVALLPKVLSVNNLDWIRGFNPLFNAVLASSVLVTSPLRL